MRTSGHGDEWMQQRAGKVTASRLADVVAKLKNGKPGASRATYMGELIAERLTNNKTDGFTSTAMQWGIDTEPMAVEAYEAANFVTVDSASFVDHPRIPMTGASPDGLVGDDGLCEIKCCNTSTHIDRLLGAPTPRKYVLQCLWQMACTERQWCDLVYFDPRMPPQLQMHIERIKRDDELIAELEKEVVSFLEEVEQRVQALKEYKA